MTYLFSMIGTVGEVALVEPSHSMHQERLGCSRQTMSRLAILHSLLQSLHAKAYIPEQSFWHLPKVHSLGKLRSFPILFRSVRDAETTSILEGGGSKDCGEPEPLKMCLRSLRTLLQQLMTAQLRVPQSRSVLNWVHRRIAQPMPTPGEHKTVQSRILRYAQEIGWSFVPHG